MKPEGHVAGKDRRAARQDLLLGLFEQRQARSQRARETRLLALEDRHDQVPVLHQHRIGRTHLLDGGVDQRGRERRLGTGAPRGQDRAADDAPKHVAAAFVRRQHAVRDEHRHRSAVVGDAPDRDVGRFVAAERHADRARGGLEQRREEVRGEYRFNAVENREGAVEPGAGVDVLLGQLGQGAARALLVLHEDEVPELHEAVFVPEGWPAVGAEGRPLVEEDLRARPARPGVAHAPEVVLVEALDALGAHADDVAPHLLGLVVGGVDRHPELLGVQAEALGDETPGQLDGAFLEVVAEREVSHHLEEGQVAQRRADDLDVRRPEALLDRHRPGVGRDLFLGEVGLERHHPRDGEQQRRVVRNQARRGNDGVPVLGEIVEKYRT